MLFRSEDGEDVNDGAIHDFVDDDWSGCSKGSEYPSVNFVHFIVNSVHFCA